MGLFARAERLPHLRGSICDEEHVRAAAQRFSQEGRLTICQTICKFQ